MHLLNNSNGQGGNSQHNQGGQDVVVKSSSDVKVFLIKKIQNFQKNVNTNYY